MPTEEELRLEIERLKAENAQLKKPARGSMSLFVSQIVGNAGFFAAALMVARGLGPAGRGTTAFITVTSLVVGRLKRTKS